MSTSNFRYYEATLALLAPLTLVALGLFVLVYGGFDESISDYYFDWETKTWPLKRGFWAQTVLHTRGRDLVFLVGLTALIVTVSGQFSAKLRPFRRRALFVVLSIGLSAGSAAIMKHFSPVPSAWDSIRYGGIIPHLSPFAKYPAGVPLGKCFPGAHASGGFAFMCAYYVLRERSLRQAWLGLTLGAGVGLLYSAAQVARGAHYWSHNLCAAGLVWTICSALYWWVFRGWLIHDPKLDSSVRPEDSEPSRSKKKNAAPS